MPENQNPYDIIAKLEDDAKKSFESSSGILMKAVLGNAISKEMAQQSYVDGYLKSILAKAIKLGSLSYEELK